MVMWFMSTLIGSAVDMLARDGWVYILIALVAVQTALALALETRHGRLLSKRMSWLVTAVLDGVVIIALAMGFELDVWLPIAGAFFVAGLPRMARVAWLQMRDYDDAREVWGDGE